MRLFGLLHCSLLALIAAVCVALCLLCRRRPGTGRPVRLALGYGLAVNEFIWWIFRYSHEGVHLVNLPLQLCDATVWVEFDYFAGIAGAGMALLTPDLWSPWPTYPAIYFFLAHGGIVMVCTVLVFGRIAPLRPGAVWRAFGLLLLYALLVGLFDAFSGANYMYLRTKPHQQSLLNLLGPWPFYLIPGAALALGLFWLLWLPAPQRRPRSVA